MTSFFVRAIDALRVWLGLNDPADNRLHPSHGWLLPAAAGVRARRTDLAPALAPAPLSAAGKRL